MREVPQPKLVQFKHARGHYIWMTRWYDEKRRRQTKTFGRVEEIGVRQATSRFEHWVRHKWMAKEEVKNPGGKIAMYTGAMLATAFGDDCKKTYRKNGKMTSYVGEVTLTMSALRDLYGNDPATSLGAPEIARIRDHMIDSKNQKGVAFKLTRKTVNGRLAIIKQAFAWARERELITQNALVDIQCVKALAFGRTTARESRSVRPVSVAAVNATLAVCTRVIRSMIEVHLFTGMRPGELVAMKPGLIDRVTEVWIYRVPAEVYKMSHKEKAPKREVYLGPQVQAILAQFMVGRNDDAYIFSPFESELERRAERNAKRKTPPTYGNKCESKVTGTFVRARFKKGSGYSTASYRRAINPTTLSAGRRDATA